MKRKTYAGLTVLMLMIALAAACNKAASNTNNANNANSNSTGNTNAATKPAETSTAQSTPTEAFKAFYEAAKGKDANALRRVVSKKTLDLMEKGAKEKGKSIEETLQESNDIPTTMPETRNEKIDGDKATLEVKEKDKWETVNFVKEDGMWKLALLDAYADTINEMEKKADDANPGTDKK